MEKHGKKMNSLSIKEASKFLV
ncbi:MAG: hypothetical protein SOZ28_00280 [Clostridia bacterium]|nr:hypothetical protein [Clostridia bacterium]